MSIKLSEKHGVNPSLMQCYVCGKDVGVVLFGKMKGDAEAPRQVCLDQEPCDECKGFMEQGVIMISVDETKSSDRDNPWRTGGWCVVRDEAVKRILDPGELLNSILEKRMCFLPDEAWDMLGLPRGDMNVEE